MKIRQKKNQARQWKPKLELSYFIVVIHLFFGLNKKSKNVDIKILKKIKRGNENLN